MSETTLKAPIKVVLSVYTEKCLTQWIKAIFRHSSVLLKRPEHHLCVPDTVIGTN